MECIEVIECTQELYDEKPEQIGYLGICGQKHPLFTGANKIGTDPETCSIIINLNFISKQHALINIINRKDLMIMDLDSIGKTIFLNKTLKPYIPYRIKDGDVVQFASIIGVVRLLEEDVQPIITQPAPIDLTESPVTEHVAEPEPPTALVPESPNAGDTISKPSCSVKEDKKEKLDIPEEKVLTDNIDGECNKHDTETVPEPIKPKLMIPEKASSFSIHPGLCKDQCSYCSIKFGIYDKPRHIALFKSLDKLKKILDADKKLSVDSCLCDACYRYVIRRNDYLTYRVQPLGRNLARKSSKKSNTKVLQPQKIDTEETQHDKLTKELGPKSETRESKELDKVDSESSEKSKNTLEADTVKEGEEQPRVDENKTLDCDAKLNDPNDQRHTSEADTQTGPIQVEEQNDPLLPPARDTIKKLREVRKVKCSIQDSDKTLEKCTRKEDLRPTRPQNESSNKDVEENRVKVDILKNILQNKGDTAETTAKSKPADIILLKNKWLVKEGDNKNKVMERIAILKNITLNEECTLEVIPRKKVPDAPDKYQMSENTSLVEDEELKESSPINSDTNAEDIAIINNAHTDEFTIKTTPRKKVLRRSRMLKNKNESKIEFVKGNHSIATNSDKTEDEVTKDVVNNVSPTEECTVEKPYKIIVSKNKWLVKRNFNKHGSKIKFAKRKHSSLMKSDNKEDRVKEDIHIVTNSSMDEKSVEENIPNDTPSYINIPNNKRNPKNNKNDLTKNKNEIDKYLNTVKMLKTNPSISVRETLPGEQKVNLNCNIEFDNVKEVTPEGFEKCDFMIQHDAETGKLWNELQRPYGNPSSFLRHLVRLGNYFKRGELSRMVAMYLQYQRAPGTTLRIDTTRKL